jgi:hypothetical protein
VDLIRFIGFGIQAGVVDGMALCRMFKKVIPAAADIPKCGVRGYDARCLPAGPPSCAGESSTGVAPGLNRRKFC